MLPGLDDGSPDCEQSLVMARIAVADGIRDVVCTPHWAPGAFENTRLPVLRALKEFQEKLCDNGIPLTVHPGAELRLDPDLIRKIDSGEILTLNDTGRFALIELPDMFLPRSLEVFFRNMLSCGITPVISHPERNHAFLRDPMPLFQVGRDGIARSDNCRERYGTLWLTDTDVLSSSPRTRPGARARNRRPRPADAHSGALGGFVGSRKHNGEGKRRKYGQRDPATHHRRRKGDSSRPDSLCQYTPKHSPQRRRVHGGKRCDRQQSTD